MEVPIYVTTEFVVMIGIMIAALLVTVRLYVKRHLAYRALSAVSEDYGLIDSSPGIWKWPSAYGTVDGRKIDVRTEKRSTSGNTSLFTIFRVQLGSDVPDEMRVGTETLLHSLGKKIGRRDIEVGVASFDRNFLVEGPGRQFGDIRALLSVPANREALRDFFELRGDTYVEDGFGYVVRSGMVSDEDVLRETVQGCLTFGENFGSGELPASTYDRIAGAMADSDTDDNTNDQPDTPQTNSKNDWWG